MRDNEYLPIRATTSNMRRGHKLQVNIIRISASTLCMSNVVCICHHVASDNSKTTITNTDPSLHTHGKGIVP